MKVEITIAGKSFESDLRNGIDISIPFHPDGPRAWYVDRMIIRPVINDQFTGSVELGGSVNFREIQFNPHGHGTHTETYEHISRESISVTDTLKNHHFSAYVITISPKNPRSTSQWIKEDDQVISLEDLKEFESQIKEVDALIIRTEPNYSDKKRKNYSNTNFPYFLSEAMEYLVDLGIQHLLVDLPSVDREEDGGLLVAHHAFWKHGDLNRKACTITEFVYLEDSIKDGLYLLNLQVAPFINDAAPSRPVIFPLDEIKS